MRQRLLLEPVLQAIADSLDDHEEMIETIGGDLRRGGVRHVDGQQVLA